MSDDLRFILDHFAPGYADGGSVRSNFDSGGRIYNPFTGRFENYGAGPAHSFFSDDSSTQVPTSTGTPVASVNEGVATPTYDDLIRSIHATDDPNRGTGDPGLGVVGPSTPANADVASIAGLVGSLGLGLAPSPVSAVGTLGGLANAIAPGVLSQGVSVNGLSTNNAVADALASQAAQVGITTPTGLIGLAQSALGPGGVSGPAVSSTSNAQAAQAPDDTGLSAALAAAASMAGEGGNAGAASAAADSAASGAGSAFRRGGLVQFKARGGMVKFYKRGGQVSSIVRTAYPKSSRRDTMAFLDRAIVGTTPSAGGK